MTGQTTTDQNKTDKRITGRIIWCKLFRLKKFYKSSQKFEQPGKKLE